MVKITTDWKVKLNPEASDQVRKAVKAGLTDTITEIAGDAIKQSPILTGNNRRSIRFEVGPGAEVAKEENTGAVYSTSGYGGYLETGTVKMSAQPYMKPALDRNAKKLPEHIRRYMP